MTTNQNPRRRPLAAGPRPTSSGPYRRDDSHIYLDPEPAPAPDASSPSSSSSCDTSSSGGSSGGSCE